MKAYIKPETRVIKLAGIIVPLLAGSDGLDVSQEEVDAGSSFAKRHDFIIEDDEE